MSKKCDYNYERDNIPINNISPLLGPPETVYSQEKNMTRTRSGGYVAWPGNSYKALTISDEDRKNTNRVGYVALPNMG